MDNEGIAGYVPIRFLFTLIGLPASGKSTFAHHLQEYYPLLQSQLEKYLYSEIPPEQITKFVTDAHNNGKKQNKQEPPQAPQLITPDIVHIDIDELREIDMCGIFRPEHENKARKKFLEYCEENLRNGKSVIADDMNYLTSMRHDLLEIARNTRSLYIPIYFECPLEVALERNDRRPNTIDPEIIENAYVKLDRPGKKYGWDKPVMVIRNTASSSENDLKHQIEQKLPQKLENILRIHLSEVMQGTTKSFSGSDSEFSIEYGDSLITVQKNKLIHAWENMSRKIFGELIRILRKTKKEDLLNENIGFSKQMDIAPVLRKIIVDFTQADTEKTPDELIRHLIKERKAFITWLKDLVDNPTEFKNVWVDWVKNSMAKNFEKSIYRSKDLFLYFYNVFKNTKK